MKISIKTRKGSALLSKKIAPGADPTEVTTIRFTRNDGAKFEAREVFGDWTFKAGGFPPVFIGGDAELLAEAKRHNLPSPEFIFREFLKKQISGN